jgi:hypothetical protein
MFLLHLSMAFGIYLIALTLAGMLMAYCRSRKELSCAGCQVIAYIVLVFALMGVICSAYYKFYMWQHNKAMISPLPVMEMMQDR